MAFEPIKRIIPSFVRDHGLERSLNATFVVQAAEETLRLRWGEQKAALVTPVSFVEGRLKFETSSPAALQELRVQQTAIMNDINRRLGKRVVLSFVFVSKGF